MTDPRFAMQAAEECASAATSAHAGGGPGRPFWNPQSTEFMYVPAFQFAPQPGCAGYRYFARGSDGVTRTFDAPTASASLEPLWRDLPEGVVELTVRPFGADGALWPLCGARTFFRLSPFPADLPSAARNWRDSVLAAYDYAFGQSFLTHWLEFGTPDPDYDRYVYPSKMIPTIIEAMINYSRLRPERSVDAMRIARASADWLIGITPGDGAPLAHLPPTYYINWRENPETRTNLKATSRIDWIMMIYPAQVGAAYIRLWKATGVEKYLNEAIKIGAFYRDHAEENGSWYMIRRLSTGEPVNGHFCGPMELILPFLESLGEVTGDVVWKKLAEGAVGYVEKRMLSSYNWEGQFEDSPCSENYNNLSHYCAAALVRYRCRNCPGDEEKMAEADDLARFLEDQFVVWKTPAPWNKSHFDPSLWHTPCAMEQYDWYVPIDNSAADIAQTFLAMYKAGRGELWLEKAKALCDSITRVQRADGMIPTHWMNDDFRNGKNLWISCMFQTARIMLEMSESLEQNG